nr:hypothetical protein CFP56_56831 [Quercus suber]
MSSTLSPSILALIVGCSSALEVWKVLENKFSSISRSHVMNLKELLHITLKGLPKEFNAFRLAIRTGSTHLSFDELSTMLNVEEESLNEGFEIKDTIFAMVAVANPKPKNNGFNQASNRGRGKGNYTNRGGRGGRGSNGQSSQFNQFQRVKPNSNGVRSASECPSSTTFAMVAIGISSIEAIRLLLS